MYFLGFMFFVCTQFMFPDSQTASGDLEYSLLGMLSILSSDMALDWVVGR